METRRVVVISVIHDHQEYQCFEIVPLHPGKSDYGECYRYGEAIATGCVESTVNPGDVLRFCRKVRFLGQNPKIEYQEFNELQTLKRSKKQLCDRTQ